MARFRTAHVERAVSRGRGRCQKTMVALDRQKATTGRPPNPHTARNAFPVPLHISARRARRRAAVGSAEHSGTTGLPATSAAGAKNMRTT